MTQHKYSLPSKIERALANCSVISFDIFGTLLKRTVPSEQTVFDIVESQASGLPFASNTPFAAKRSALDNAEYFGHIPTIEEIYKLLHLPEEDALCRLEAEQNTERSILIPNPFVKEIYNRAIELGKTVVITSDMYFSSSFLSSLLREKGYEGFDRVFVSCEFNKNKGSGELFDEVLAYCNTSPDKILHIGDSLKADIQGARKRGITSLYVGSPLFEKVQKKIGRASNTPSPLFGLSFPAESDLFNKGFRSLGPLLVAFSQWVHSTASFIEESYKLFFLARDTKLLMDAYAVLYPEDKDRIHYLYLSRRSIGLACLSNCDDLRTIKSEISFQRYISWAALMDNLGIAEGVWKTILAKESFPFYDAYPQDDFFANADVQRLYSTMLPTIKKRQREQEELLRKYLTSSGVDDNAIIVDIGWHGTIQRMLERLLCRNVSGLYVGTSTTKDCDARGFLFDDEHMENDSIIASFGCLFETFFFAGHGTTDHYELDEAGNPSPVLDRCEYTDEELADIREFQHGAMEFVSIYAQTGLTKYLLIDKNTALDPLKSIGFNPSKNDVRLFGSFNYLEYGETKPLVPEKIDPTLYLHPKKIVEGFFLSKWKSGYLKQLLKLPLPYGSLYVKLRKGYKSAQDKH